MTGPLPVSSIRAAAGPVLMKSLPQGKTIYILSKEGAGSSAPLTIALTEAIGKAMEERAEGRGGRPGLPVR